jgi:hypothetical protein
MVTVATLLQTVFHPGFCFPRLAAPLKHSELEEKKIGYSSDENV